MDPKRSPHPVAYVRELEGVFRPVRVNISRGTPTAQLPRSRSGSRAPNFCAPGPFCCVSSREKSIVWKSKGRCCEVKQEKKKFILPPWGAARDPSPPAIIQVQLSIEDCSHARIERQLQRISASGRPELCTPLLPVDNSRGANTQRRDSVCLETTRELEKERSVAKNLFADN
eukprot:3120349-Rhodomonas_salina.3